MSTPPPGYGYPPAAPQPAASNGIATAGMVLGIIALVVSFIPVLNVVVWPLAIIGLVLGSIGLAKSGKTGKGKGPGITALATSLASIIMFFVINAAFVNEVDKAVDGARKDIKHEQKQGQVENKRAATEDVKITTCAIKPDGLGGRELDVKLLVTNNGKDRAGYSIEGEAVDQNGDQITTIDAYVSDLNHGAKKRENDAAFAMDDDLKDVTKVTCKILDVDRTGVLR
ncbi:DUF4190 domain-containing protein [Streptomyces sp. NPDC048483]|uniref:DUF4190 domain-containing protein n=1 Tax=Streptomyces sp. NPDC048483 TaxID=3154927 RepID=UPI0034233ACC